MIGNDCPICGIEMNQDRDTLDGWILLEESHDCPAGHYSYYYDTGTTCVTIGKKQIYWNYHTTFSEMERIEYILNKMIILYKKIHNIGDKDVQ